MFSAAGGGFSVADPDTCTCPGCVRLNPFSFAFESLAHPKNKKSKNVVICSEGDPLRLYRPLPMSEWLRDSHSLRCKRVSFVETLEGSSLVARFGSLFVSRYVGEMAFINEAVFCSR